MDPSVMRLLECAKDATADMPATRRVRVVGDLVRALGISPQTLTNWKSRGISKDGALLAERFFGCAPSYVIEGIGPARQASANEGLASHPVAQSLSLRPFETPPHIQQGELMSIAVKGLPATFSAAVWDEALAPQTPKGTVLVFEVAAMPQPGHGVLVQDATGARYVRRYIPGTAGRWVAGSRNDAYPPMDSERDGLTLLAVATGRLDGAV
jgi:hypothetical protein